MEKLFSVFSRSTFSSASALTPSRPAAAPSSPSAASFAVSPSPVVSLSKDTLPSARIAPSVRNTPCRPAPSTPSVAMASHSFSKRPASPPAPGLETVVQPLWFR